MIFNNFQKGIASSPYLTDGAFSKSANLDIFSQLGIAKINYKPVKKSGSVVNELIYNFERNPADYLVTEWRSPTANKPIDGMPPDRAWTNPSNVYNSDNAYAIASQGTWKYHCWYNFGFNVPSGVVIRGIEVKVEAKVNTTAYCGDNTKIMVALTKNKNDMEGIEYTDALTTSDANYYLGGPSSLWGTTWTPAEVNHTDFGVSWVHGACGSTPETIYSIDNIQIRIYFQANPNQIFASGESGTIYKSEDGGDTWEVFATNKGNYIKIWKNYLFAVKNTVINVYSLASGTWTNFFKTNLEKTPEHFMLVSENDGNLYISNGKKIASFTELTTFNPADSNSYSYTPNHLTLHEPFQAVCLAEHREDLLIGAIQGTPANPKVSSSIFIWDRVANEFQYPLSLSGEFVTAMLGVQNRTYIVTDLYGKVYSYSESGLIPLKQLPFDYDNGKHIRIGHKGHQSMGFWRNRILLGVSSTDGLSPAGIWGLYDKNLNCEHLISTMKDGSEDDVIIGAIYPLDGDNLLYSWYDAKTEEYGIDKITSSYNRVSGYKSYFETIFQRAGTHLKPANFSKIEIQLSRNLQTGEGVRLLYRRNIADNWTEIGTKDYATLGAESSIIFDKGLFGIRNIQLRVELTTGANSQNTPQILDIKLLE